MKYLSYLLFFFLFLVSTQNSFSQAPPQYYNYNVTGNANSFPFNIAGGKEVQILFLAGDFAQPTPAPGGNITGLSFRLAAALGPYTYTNFVIKMGQTSLTTFDAGVWYTGQLDTVYSRASVSLGGNANEWMTITLDRPYNYNPSQSLIVDVNQCSAVGATGFSTGTTTLAGNRRNTSLTTSACPFVWGQQSGTVPHMGVNIAPPLPSSWFAQTSGSTLQLNSISAPNNNVCWIAGGTASAVVLRTINGGTWTNVTSNITATLPLYNIWGVDANTALVTGSSAAATFVYKTTNGGANWTQVFTQALGFIDAIWMSDANNGFMYGDPVPAAGGRWSLWRTTNGGTNWDSTGCYLPQTGSEAGWNDAMYVNGNNIWFGTNNTKIYYSTTGGTSWASQPSTGQLNTQAVWFNGTTGYCGGSSDLLYSTNSGTLWSPQTSVGTGTVQQIQNAPGSSTWWMVRQGTGIYKTTNNGTSWTTDFTITGTSWQLGVSRTGSVGGNAWVATTTGGIYKYGLTTSVTPVINEVPKDYLLSQNYPNPFNPSTKIEFTLPKGEIVQMKLYDILGKEVAVLAEGPFEAGKHSLDLNLSYLTSGTYFYRITAGGFTDTKKLLLMK